MEREEDTLELYALLATCLKEAHAQVRGMDVPNDVRAALTRRLLVITASARHDLAGAKRRLDRFGEELETAGSGGLVPGESRSHRPYGKGRAVSHAATSERWAR